MAREGRVLRALRQLPTPRSIWRAVVDRARREKEAPAEEARQLLALFPESARPLLAAKGVDLVARIGIDAVRDVVLQVLTGRNIRDSTEALTRRRLALVNAASVVMYVAASGTMPNAPERIPEIAAAGLG